MTDEQFRELKRQIADLRMAVEQVRMAQRQAEELALNRHQHIMHRIGNPAAFPVDVPDDLKDIIYGRRDEDD